MNEQQAETITIEDLKHRAIAIKDLAEAEARSLAQERATQAVAVAAVVVLAAISLAFFIGSRRR